MAGSKGPLILSGIISLRCGVVDAQTRKTHVKAPCGDSMLLRSGDRRLDQRREVTVGPPDLGAAGDHALVEVQSESDGLASGQDEGDGRLGGFAAQSSRGVVRVDLVGLLDRFDQLPRNSELMP